MLSYPSTTGPHYRRARRPRLPIVAAPRWHGSVQPLPRASAARRHPSPTPSLSGAATLCCCCVCCAAPFCRRPSMPPLLGAAAPRCRSSLLRPLPNRGYSEPPLSAATAPCRRHAPLPLLRATAETRLRHCLLLPLPASDRVPVHHCGGGLTTATCTPSSKARLDAEWCSVAMLLDRRWLSEVPWPPGRAEVGASAGLVVGAGG